LLISTFCSFEASPKFYIYLQWPQQYILNKINWISREYKLFLFLWDKLSLLPMLASNELWILLPPPSECCDYSVHHLNIAILSVLWSDFTWQYLALVNLMQMLIKSHPKYSFRKCKILPWNDSRSTVFSLIEFMGAFFGMCVCMLGLTQSLTHSR
jgi:hypothetical protein